MSWSRIRDGTGVACRDETTDPERPRCCSRLYGASVGEVGLREKDVVRTCEPEPFYRQPPPHRLKTRVRPLQAPRRGRYLRHSPLDVSVVEQRHNCSSWGHGTQPGRLVPSQCREGTWS